MGLTYTYSQNTFTLSGRILDEKKQPLSGVSIFLQNTFHGTFTNRDGYFTIYNLEKGQYIINISHISYKTIIDTILVNHDIYYDIEMKPSTISLQEVVINDLSFEKREKEESLNLEIVNNQYLKQNIGGSLMNSLERLAGITTIDIGTGQSKPVIRGLGFNRVVVVENGVKHEGQQWGADHGLEIDQYNAETIEIIKGPVSIMYGSDAIGGIIDIKQNKIPLNNSINVILDLIGKSNNNLMGSSILISGRKKSLFMNLRTTLINYGDYKVPTDSIDIYSYRAALYKQQLRNTAGNEQNIHYTLGIIQHKFTTKLFISNIYNKSGFFANAHGIEPRNVDTLLHDKSGRDILYPYHQVNHFKIINKSQWNRSHYKIETDFGFQRNFRQEWSTYVNHGFMPATFPDSLPFPSDLELQLDKYIYSANLKPTFYLNEKTTITTGINYQFQKNKIDGRSFIIPEFSQFTIGSYAYTKYYFSNKSILHFGIRYDYSFLHTESYYDWFKSPNENYTLWSYLQRSNELKKHFYNTSWSIGYIHNLENLIFKINGGKSFRIPDAKELAANGVNYHHFSFEVGNPNLSPEISYQIDAAIEYRNKKFAFEISPFVNYFTHYIYLNPSAQYDRLYGNGNQVFYYTESEVLRYGSEFHSHYEIIPNIQLGVIAEYVHSQQMSGEKKGYNLPFSPPASILFNLKFKKDRLKFAENLYCSLDYKLTSTQKEIVPPEEITQGYQLLNLSLGSNLYFNNHLVIFSFQIQNILNTKYFNHTSFYRLINVPEPGRNIVINITIPFSSNLNKSKQN
ncbi:MAG: TonB-dependent receptor [Bacteroidales bacterium]|nr:TonB-dependent receptor [Bacteroidales bacterium]